MTAAAYALSAAAHDSQQTFRRLLDAMSRPGSIESVDPGVSCPAALVPASAAIARCVFDHDTHIWMGDGIAGVEVFDFLKFHCGCQVTKSSMVADFAIVCSRSGLPSVTQFKQGTDSFPDRSTTLIVQVPDLWAGPTLNLAGPGIETESALNVSGVPDYFWQERRVQNGIFPRGVDVVFVSGNEMVALPRSTRLGD